MPARGNIEYTQIAEDSRNGTGAWIQMYGGGTVPSPGNMAVFDVNLNVIDGGPPGSGGGGGNLVTSVFGRTGAVVGAAGDYTAAQVTNAVDATQSYTNPAWIISLPWSKITGAPITGVGSFNGRTGAIMPMTGDYTVSMIPGAVADPTTTIGDLLVRGISSIARLGVGSNGQVLTADSTQPLGVHWATPTGGGGSGSQTPWLSDIQGAGYSLWNTQAVEVDGGLLGNAYNSGGWRYRTANSAFMLQTSGGQGTLFNTAPAGAPGVLINFVNALTFADSGNIGVGTVSPNYKLDVAGPVNSNACYFVNGVSFACSDGASGINLSNITNINGMPPGTGGGGGAGQIEETPVGRMDGTNTSFTLSHAPGPNALSLFLDGVLQQQGVDYTLTGNTIVYTVAPNSADWHVAVYGLGGEVFPVMSVFGRTGAVVGNTGDYIAAQITDAVDQGASYANPQWITSLDWSKITNAPAPGTYQTPWLSNIDAGQYQLNNASQINFTSSSAPFRTGYVNCNAVGMNIGTGAGTAMSISAINPITIASNISINSSATTPAGTAYTWVVTSGVTAMAIYANARIAVGISGAPQYSLDLAGDINITGQYRVNGTPIGAGGSQTPWLQNVDAANYTLSNVGAIHSTSVGGNLIYPADSGYEWWLGAFSDTVSFQVTHRQIASPNAWSAFLTVETNGNCGIGTTSPTASLDIYRTDGNYQIKIESASQIYGIAVAGGSSDFVIDDVTRSINRFNITPSGSVCMTGNVGCGYSSPPDALSISGFGTAGQAQIRMAYGNYGVMLRNDGADFYILLTNSGDPWGNFNTLRPLYIDLATGNVTIPSLVSNASIPSYYAGMTGGSVILTGSWQAMPGCAFTVNQTGRFLVMINAEVQSQGTQVVQIGLFIAGGGVYGQPTYHYVLGTLQSGQQMVVTGSAGQQFTLQAIQAAGTGTTTIYPACTNITAIYLGP